jgi:hypothetical protein
MATLSIKGMKGRKMYKRKKTLGAASDVFKLYSKKS